MFFNLKSLLKKTFVYRLLISYRVFIAEKKADRINREILSEWNEQGRPIPPPHIYKIQTVKKYAKENHINILIETGTYLGDTIEACKKLFKQIISVELNHDLSERAKNIFSDNHNIKIYEGDSGLLLKDILSSINEPCLFWLDGHYSKGITSKGDLNTPILKELEHIFNHPLKNHVILIDDARAFVGKNDYPNIVQLQALIKSYNPNNHICVKDDIIRIHL